MQLFASEISTDYYTCPPAIVSLLMFTITYIRAMALHIYMKSSFPKHVKRHFKKRGVQCQCQGLRLFLEKSFSYLYIYAYISTYLWGVIFQNMISELGIGDANSNFGLALNAFWKRALHIHRVGSTTRQHVACTGSWTQHQCRGCDENGKYCA